MPPQFQRVMQECGQQPTAIENEREPIRTNVRSSHATLIFTKGLPLEANVRFADDFARSALHSHFVVDLLSSTAKDEVLKWLRNFLGMSSALVLNVVGPSEAASPGIQIESKSFLSEILWEA